MVTVVFRTAGLVLECLAADKDLARSFVEVADLGDKAVKSCTAAANRRLAVRVSRLTTRKYVRF